MMSNTLFPRAGGLHPPPDVLLSWPRPNYDNPETRGPEVPNLLIALFVITFLIYVARMWARLVLSKNAGWDDLIMSIAMFPLLGLTISAYFGLTTAGFQWHTWDQTKKTFVTSRQVTMSIELNYLASTTLIKISILMFYRRFAGSLTHTFIYLVWANIIWCAIYGIVYTMLIIFMCNPVAGYFHMFDFEWRFTHPNMHCRDEGPIVVSCAIMSTVQDLVICMLPVVLIWNLQIARRQKIAVCGIFAMGLVTCFCGIMRSYYASYCFFFTYDITWPAFHGWTWTVIEAQMAVICTSAPACYALICYASFLLEGTADFTVSLVKIFFIRYFASQVSQLGLSGSGSRQTPMRSLRNRGYGKMLGSNTANSTARSQTGGLSVTEMPLGGITVSQDLEVHVVDRDDISQKSIPSTKHLTALPKSDQGGEASRKSEWLEGCRTVCAAAMSRDHSRSRSPLEKDLERGTS